MAEAEDPKPVREPSLTRNTISSLGMLIALIALANLIFLIIVDSTAAHSNPYLGILAWLVAPGILCFGIAVFLLGIVLERRRRRRVAPGEVPQFPRIDFNVGRTRTIVSIVAILAVVFLTASVIGSYHVYEYTDSDAFCGTLCHSVMAPEYTAYKLSPHARVGCVNCHVGAGATWYVKSKLSGAYQVYSVLFKKYPRPIPTPVHNLRPAQETCEQCHWPEKFWGAQLKVFDHYQYDETNTPKQVKLLIKTGGGTLTSGFSAGIHSHMNIANEITYVSTDDHRQQIPWVRMRDRKTGQVTEFRLEGSKITDAQIAAGPKRVMDCVDCHNRPSHIYTSPDRSVDRAIAAGKLDPTLPFLKQQAVTLLAKDYKTTDEAKKAIANDLPAYYQKQYAALYVQKRGSVDNAVTTLQEVFASTRFPEMRVDWRTHPSNIGHMETLGCFRCHDDQHVSKDGRRISKDCNICHTLLPETGAAATAQFQHPVDLGDLRAVNCADCHTGNSMQ